MLSLPPCPNYQHLNQSLGMMERAPNSLSSRYLVATPFKLCAHGHFLPFLYYIVLPEYFKF